MVEPHKVSKLQLRLPYCRILFQHRLQHEKTQISLQIMLLQAKIGFRIHNQWFLWCFSLVGKNCVSSVLLIFYSKDLSKFGKILGSIFLKVRKDFKVFKRANCTLNTRIDPSKPSIKLNLNGFLTDFQSWWIGALGILTSPRIFRFYSPRVQE